MQKNNDRYFYQPDLYSMIIFWSWTFVILFISGTGWLEITHVQWFTIAMFILFLLITFLGIWRRQLIVDQKQQTITLRGVLPGQKRVLPFKQISQVRQRKHRLIFTVEPVKQQFSIHVGQKAQHQITKLLG
ncbi:hypothetical protein BSQ39_07570 [Loigolactobacillus backii]|uniref:EbsA family protein n=1 Tax=Loigolactobacillus backii TaxID=375175 RepID=UPI000C1CACE4|nr:EbsA family protein [Loigolactobacillus backii]PIO83424.1 hypothetical protein BSQ39_07570 [Loigolactobacillus backii]